MGDEELQELKVLNENHTDKIKPTVNNNALLEAVLNNRIDEIPHLIETSTQKLIDHTYSQHGNKKILIIAVINENVSKDTLQTLYTAVRNHYLYIDCVDEGWYKWEPIHYAAKIGNPEKLQVLVDILDNVQSLTVFSENALHVLLEYEKSIKPFNTLLYDGPESRNCTIINAEKDNVKECAKILIDAGVDVNHSNFWNETPICIAARYRYREVIKLLLNTAYIDLDSYSEEGMKIREYLQKQLNQDTLSHTSFPHEDPVKILFNFLKSEQVQAFLQFNNENIRDYVNCIDGDSEHNTSGNMLQLCFRKGFLEYVQHDLYEEELTECDIMNTPMLKTFLDKGLGQCIKHLLNNGADPKLIYRKFPETLLEAAAVRGYYPLVAILLQHKSSNITTDDIYEVLPKLFEDKYKLQNSKFYRKHVLNLLLNKLLCCKGEEVLTSEKLHILNEIICQLNLECDDEKEDDSENICQILKLGSPLTKKVGKNTVMQRLHPSLLQTHFDDCIDNNIFCYNSLVEDDEKYSETKALRFLINDKKRIRLLRHPLLIHFIHNKWLRIFYFFYLDLLFYTGFLISLYTYMIFANTHYKSKLVDTLFYILLVAHFLKEGIQLVFLYRLKYFLDTANYLELTTLISCVFTIFYQNIYSMTISILFSTVIFTLFLGQLPIFAKYTIIFGSTKYFLQYAGFYFMQFLSFALIFFILFPFEKVETNTSETKENYNNATNDRMGDIFKSLFYTLIMFTGEFNERVLEPEKNAVFGRLIMTIFIFCMTIILNNLLVGLIVADMDDLQREGKLYKQVRTANFIVKANSFIKRLHEFKAYHCIKNIINFFHVFQKRENKILDITACSHVAVFDDEDKQYLKEIRNKKNAAYDKNVLKNLYLFIKSGYEIKRENGVY